jgi:hypothetical protein
MGAFLYNRTLEFEYPGMNHALLIRTAASWKIPRALALQVIERDTQCIYCGLVFAEPFTVRATCPSWEHIVNDLSLISLENIGLCCVSCNASKGKKPLQVWLKSKYCAERAITSRTIATVAGSLLDGQADAPESLAAQTAREQTGA